MNFKYLILAVIFLALTLFQESFWAHFVFWGLKLNWILGAVFLVVFFRKHKPGSYFEVWSPLIAGLCLDIFSAFPFGIFTFCFVGAALSVQRISQFLEKSSVASFYILFLVYFAVYKLLFFGLTLSFPSCITPVLGEMVATGVLVSFGLLHR